MQKNDLVSIEGMFKITNVYVDDDGIKRYEVNINGASVFLTENKLVKAPEPSKVDDFLEMRAE